ncbi:MAG: hypothetical protein F2763_04730 [Actinobacteria bacterium]|uniref:Unannotated protein n=1 Tax=freshwater metagenome TaxID=449393 RepID=A0A6J7AEG8_9ZZZZ|nr:hypothetical protein [Actinomycetota bacterium]
MAPPLLVGLDMGTTRVKAVAVDLAGQQVAEAALPTPWRHHGAEAELDPIELATTATAVLTMLSADPGWPAGAKVTGIGVTGMAETGVLLDAAGQVVAPALAWHDPRGEVEFIEKHISRSDFHRHVGMRLNSKPSVAKILWLQRNIPGAEKAVRHLCVAEWIVFHFGGEHVGELSLTSRTGFFDIVICQPWEQTLKLTGDLLPSRFVVAGEDCGAVRGELPDAFIGATLTVAGMDHQSAAFASGAAISGSLFNSMGTAEAIMRFEPAPISRDQLELLVDQDAAVLWGVIPDHVCILGATLAGLSLERVHALLGIKDRNQSRELARAALNIDRSKSALKLDPASHRGLRLSGIDDDASPALTWRVAVEDLLEQSATMLSFVESVVGPRTSAVVGGGWIHDVMVADVKKRQLGDYRVCEVNEPGAVGAALFAGIATGVVTRPGPVERPTWPQA